MKKFFIVFALILLFNSYALSEDYHDIVVYKLPSHAESQAQSFLSSIRSDGAILSKEGRSIYIIVLSKGYGLEMYEYKLYSLESKTIISRNSQDYYKWKRLF